MVSRIVPRQVATLSIQHRHFRQHCVSRCWLNTGHDLTFVLALTSGATITVIPTTTVVSTVPPGGSYSSGSSGSYYVYTSDPTGSSSMTSGDSTGGGGATLCYTCCLTPTVITGGSTGGPTGGNGDIPMTGTSRWSDELSMTTMTTSSTLRRSKTFPPPITKSETLADSFDHRSGTPQPAIGTTVLFTTHTITSCIPAVCPASGYIIGGNPTQSGATIVTTTDNNGHTVTYTQIPTGSGNGGVTGGNGGTAPPTNTELPTCPKSNNADFTSPMGMIYQVMCDTYFTDDSLDTQTQDSLASCVASCDMYNIMSFMISSPCLGVSWYSNRKQENCELKAGNSGIYQRRVDSARLKTPYTGPTGGNGTNPGNGGVSSGGSGITATGSMTAPPVVTTFVTGGSTIVTGGSTVVTGGSTILTGGSTIVVGGSTYVTGGSTYVSGGSTVVQTVTGGSGGNGGNGGNGGATGPGMSSLQFT